jgi:hypothetical protein
MSIKTNFPAIKPSLLLDFANTKALDPRITFTRASIATYYDGKTVAKAEENLLTYSQDFANAIWVTQGAAIVGNNSAAPDGTTTAGLCTASAGSAFHNFEQLKASAVQASTPIAVSVYLKAGTYSLATLIIECAATTAWVAVTVNLSTGTVTSTGAGALGTHLSSSIASAGNGWYRVTLVGSTTYAFNKHKVAFASSATPAYANYGNDVWTAAGTETIYAWGAQLEQRSSVTAYNATTASPITNYTPVLQTAAAGVARFDHNPLTGESLGFLSEEQRANLLVYSDQFSNSSYWTQERASALANVGIAPDGTQTADLFIEDTTASNSHRAYRTITQSTGGDYTASVYVKAAGRTKFRMSEGFSIGGVCVFDLVAGTATTTAPAKNGAIVAVGNGWYRCSATWTLTASTNTILYFGMTDAAGNANYTGDGYSGVLVWGAQLEAGAFATSYIPTAASQVTRSADLASLTGANFSSWFNPGAGTLLCEFDLAATSVAMGMAPFSADGGSSNGYNLYKQSLAAGIFAYAGSNNASLGTMSAGVAAKGAVAYDGSSNVGALNGATPVAISPIPVSTPTQLLFGRTWGGNQLSGHIKRFAYYPARLTSANHQALTA